MPTQVDAQPEKEFIAGIVVGAVLGTGLALVLSAHEGKHLKLKLREKAREILDILARDEPPEPPDDQPSVQDASPHIRSLQSRGRKIARRFLNVKR